MTKPSSKSDSGPAAPLPLPPAAAPPAAAAAAAPAKFDSPARQMFAPNPGQAPEILVPAPAEPGKPPLPLKLGHPPGVDTNFLDNSRAVIDFHWSNGTYWRIHIETERDRNLHALLPPFDPKRPPDVRPADVLKALAEVYREEPHQREPQRTEDRGQKEEKGHD